MRLSRITALIQAAGLLVGLAAPVVSAAAQSARGSVIYVDADATGAETGQSWDDAFTDLQDALAVAEAGEEVWVAEGTYMPTDGANRTVSFELTSGVALYGGFDGTEQDRDERDWTEHETILSGDVGVPGDSTDNAYHVVVANGVDAAAVLDGFTVERGMARGGDPPHDRGAGVLAIGGSPTLRNDFFFRNLIGSPAGGLKPGGGLYVSEGAPLIEDCLFEENRGNSGGGAHFSDSAPTLRRVTFRDNSAGQLFFADGSGGLVEDVLIEDGERSGVFIVGSSPRFVRTTFRDNRSPSDGGGVRISAIGDEGEAAPVFEDCLFEGNTAGGGDGGAVYMVGDASPLFLRTTFRGNAASNVGGAVHVRSEAVFLGCRFERNRASGDGGAVTVDGTVTVLGSVFAGNASANPALGGGAISLIGPPLSGDTRLVAGTLFVGNEGALGGAVFAYSTERTRLVNVTFAGNEARESGGAIYAFDASGLEVQNAVLWGNTAPTGPEVFVAEGAPPVIAQSIVAGGYPAGTMILDADPLFVRPPDPGPDGTWGTEDDDYGDLRLQEGSPAVDYGLAEYLPPDTWDLDGDGDTTEPLPVDLAGNPRVIGAVPDLGAYEGAVRVSNEPGEPPAEAESLRVWPNPAASVLHIQADADEVVLYDVLGREVLRLHLDGVTEGESLPRRVGLSGLAPGVYVVRAGVGEHILTRSITLLK